MTHEVEGPILVVGAGPGLGLAVAARFGGRRSPVALVSRNSSRHDDYLAYLRGRGISALAYAVDVRDSGRFGAAVRDAEQRLGSIATMYYGPGADDPTVRPAPIVATVGDDLDKAMSYFVRPAADVTQLVLPGMNARGRGVLLYATGLGSVVPLPGLGAMAVASAALRTYALTLNAALTDAGIFAGALVIGGLIDGGDIHRHAVGSLDERQARGLPVLDPQRVADAAFDLATERRRAELVFDALSAHSAQTDR